MPRRKERPKPAPMACVLCGGRAEFLGFFFPNEAFARRIGQPAGKRRTVAYKLCRACVHLPDSLARVEKAMLRDLGVQ